MTTKQLTRKDFAKPRAVSAVQRAFPASVVGDWLPPRAWFEEDGVPRSWLDFVHGIFAGGVADIALIPKEGIDPELAWGLWHWFEEGEYRGISHDPRDRGKTIMHQLKQAP